MKRSSGWKTGIRKTNVDRAAELAAEREKEETKAWLEKFDGETHEWEQMKMDSATFDENFLEKLRLDRNILEKLVYKPTFDQIIVGCVVRVKLGHDYQVGTIFEVKKSGKPYVLGKALTNSRLLVKFPRGDEMWIEMIHVSNQKFTTCEFQDWKIPMPEDGFPSVTYIKHKLVAIRKLSLYELSKEQMKEIEEEKRVLRLPMQNIVMQKVDLLAARREALGNRNYDLAEELTAQIAEIDRKIQEKHPPLERRPYKLPDLLIKRMKRPEQNVGEATEEKPEKEPVAKQQKTDSCMNFDVDLDIRIGEGTEEEGTEEEDTEKEGTEEEGTEKEGTEKEGTDKEGTEEEGTEEEDTEKEGTEEEGTEKEGTEKEGTEKSE